MSRERGPCRASRIRCSRMSRITTVSVPRRDQGRSGSIRRRPGGRRWPRPSPWRCWRHWPPASSAPFPGGRRTRRRGRDPRDPGERSSAPGPPEQRDVVRGDGVQEQVDVVATELEQAHVADVKEASRLADGQVLLQYRAVADRHLPAGKGRHLGRSAGVNVVQRRLLQRGFGYSSQVKEAGLLIAGRIGAGLLADPVGLVKGPAPFLKVGRIRRAGFPVLGQLVRQATDDDRAGSLGIDIIVRYVRSRRTAPAASGPRAIPRTWGSVTGSACSPGRVASGHRRSSAGRSVPGSRSAASRPGAGHTRRWSWPRCRSRGRGPFDLDHIPLAAHICGGLVQEIVVRVAAGVVTGIEVDAAGQVDDVSLGFLQQVKVDLGPVDRAVATGKGVGRMAWRRRAMISASCVISGRAKATLADPGCAQANAAGVAALLSPGMVLRLSTMPARSRMRAAMSPMRGVPPSHRGSPGIGAHALAVHEQHVRVGPAIGDAQAVPLELGGQVPGVLHHLALQLGERARSGPAQRPRPCRRWS
jgi:hypothetical protein